jgi:hypothetical protein
VVSCTCAECRRHSGSLSGCWCWLR